MIDLSLVTIDELIDEINKRTDIAVIAYIQTLTDKHESSRFSFHGGRFACAGLLESFKYKMLSLINSNK